jgi:Uma2 family endonuclease
MTEEAEKRASFTYGDYATWPEGERWELIEGRAYTMSPAPSIAHQHVSMRLGTQLVALFEEQPCHVFAAPFDVRLAQGDETDDEIDTVVQPDLLVVCDGGRGRLDDKGCRGAPDLVIEILSPSTAAKDHIVKRALFEKHGVRELWLVHPVDRVVTTYLADDGGDFGAATIVEAKGRQGLGAFPGLEVDWDSVWSTLPKQLVAKEGQPPPYGS